MMCSYFDSQVSENAIMYQNPNTQYTSKNIVSSDDYIYRNSKISFIHVNNDNNLIFQKLNNLIENINNTFYQFNLYGFDFIQYTEYIEGQFYKPHIDLHLGNVESEPLFQVRKLSITILLNDPFEYEGGDLVIWNSPSNLETTQKKKGRVFAFPSFVPHEVTPITSGIRKSIVIWVVGPKFI